MDAAAGAGGMEAANGGIEGSADPCSSAVGGYRLSVQQIVGGGKAADIILWKRRRVTVGVIFGATMAWLLFEKSELSFLTICCDVLLILIVVQFIRVKISGLLNKQPRPLPELVLSEEMVSNAAASFRVKINNILLIAHDITLGKDFRLFFQDITSEKDEKSRSSIPQAFSTEEASRISDALYYYSLTRRFSPFNTMKRIMKGYHLTSMVDLLDI